MVKKYICAWCGSKTEFSAQVKSWQCPKCNENNTEVNMTVLDLKAFLQDLDDHADIRIGDVTEGSDLHTSVGAIIKRGQSIIFLPGDDDIWKDETLTPDILEEILYAAPLEEDLLK